MVLARRFTRTNVTGFVESVAFYAASAAFTPVVERIVLQQHDASAFDATASMQNGKPLDSDELLQSILNDVVTSYADERVTEASFVSRLIGESAKHVARQYGANVDDLQRRERHLAGSGIRNFRAKSQER